MLPNASVRQTASVSVFGLAQGPRSVLARRDWLPSLTPAQRSYLGFPSADSSFWTAETIARTAARYPALDIRPMQAQIRSGDGTRNQREGASPTETVLSDEQCEQWRSAGFVLAEGLMPPELMQAVVAQAREHAGYSQPPDLRCVVLASLVPAWQDLMMRQSR